MPIIHLIRHGETNANGRYYAGRRDVPLTAQGHQQARDIHEKLKDLPVSAVFSSPLQRARDTARPLALGRGLKVTICEDLSELDFGELEGKPKAEITLSLRKQYLYDPIPDGESLSQLWGRTGCFADRLNFHPSASHIAVVGHYWTNRLLFGHLSGLSFETTTKLRTYRPQTGSFVTVSTAGREMGCNADV